MWLVFLFRSAGNVCLFFQLLTSIAGLFRLICASLRGRRKKVRGGEREKSAKGKNAASGRALFKLFIIYIFNVVVTSRGKGHYDTIGEFTTSLKMSFSFSY